MKIKDYHRLQKLMMSTTSDNDHEALQAIRSANAILKHYAIDWNRVFSRTVQVVDEVEEAPRDLAAVRAEEIETAFGIVEGADSTAGDFASFIASLREQWDRSGHLSAAQEEALFKSAKRINEFKNGRRR